MGVDKLKNRMNHGLRRLRACYPSVTVKVQIAPP
jgi:hypothetical protein